MGKWEELGQVASAIASQAKRLGELAKGERDPAKRNALRATQCRLNEAYYLLHGVRGTRSR